MTITLKIRIGNLQWYLVSFQPSAPKFTFYLTLERFLSIPRVMGRGGGGREVRTNPTWDVNIEVMENKLPWENSEDCQTEILVFLPPSFPFSS